MPSFSNIFLFVLIHQQQKIKQTDELLLLVIQYLKRCDMRVCNMISVSFVQYVNFPLLARSFLRLFLFHNNETQRNFFVLNNNDTSDSHVYAYLRVYICVYVCITIYAYVRINIRMCV